MRCSDLEWGTLNDKLADFAADGLLNYDETALWICPEGLPFLRNVCMAFDHYLTQHEPTRQLFSQTV